ncbi:uncharacterized protein A4U43_C01F18260 [Asparagus officinalis]|uniref:Uncharacterized protein n=1 Tax=Asparagus officinalis TaxID=4686 RepID=A0A5P1FQA6_ASPOF|nr:uncharacterized protein A4U43_C01F18260 [Asparagus officinalis]
MSLGFCARQIGTHSFLPEPGGKSKRQPSGRSKTFGCDFYPFKLDRWLSSTCNSPIRDQGKFQPLFLRSTGGANRDHKSSEPARKEWGYRSCTILISGYRMISTAKVVVGAAESGNYVFICSLWSVVINLSAQ